MVRVVLTGKGARRSPARTTIHRAETRANDREEIFPPRRNRGGGFSAEEKLVGVTLMEPDVVIGFVVKTHGVKNCAEAVVHGGSVIAGGRHGTRGIFGVDN